MHGYFITILETDGFVIDVETASEFKTFCESSDNAKKPVKYGVQISTEGTDAVAIDNVIIQSVGIDFVEDINRSAAESIVLNNSIVAATQGVYVNKTNEKPLCITSKFNFPLISLSSNYFSIQKDGFACIDAFTTTYYGINTTVNEKHAINQGKINAIYWSINKNIMLSINSIGQVIKNIMLSIYQQH